MSWKHRSERYGEKLATPDTSVGDLIGDIDPIKVAQGRTLGDPETDPLRPGAPHQPRHLRGERAARPGRAHPGGAAERAGGARHPGARLPAADAAGPAAAGQREPRGLHQPRTDHHPAQGPVRRRGPHALPARPVRRADTRRAGGGGAVVATPTTARRSCPRTSSRWSARFARAVRDAPQVDQRSGVSARFAIAGVETVAASAVRRAAINGEHGRCRPGRATCRASSPPHAARSSSTTRTRAASSRCSNTCCAARRRRLPRAPGRAGPAPAAGEVRRAA